MKILLVLLLASLLSACVHPPRLYRPTIDRVQDSIVRITNVAMVETWAGAIEQPVVCTGEVVAPKRILTANHCLGDGPIYVDGVLAILVKKDVYYDLALLQTETTRPVLTFRTTPVRRYETVTAIGYAFGLTRLFAMTARVLLVDYAPNPSLPPGIIVQSNYIGGMSGGPVVDSAGKMVGIAQITNEGVGYGVSTTLIQVFLLGTK